jgi:uncharacterized phage protein (TIGR02218 family)
MRTLPPGLQAHLDGGATTLAWCWRLTRRDGQQLGFTDHDRPLTFAATTFEAASGFTATELKDGIGLSVDSLDVSSALRSDSLNETDLAGGLFDDARVEIYRVNWSDPAQRVLMRAGSIGEVRRTGTAFTAEVRGLAHYLQQPRGRTYQRACDADLGDTKCGVDLTLAAHRGTGTVVSIDAARLLTVSGLDSFASGSLARGQLAWTSGPNVGSRIEIKRHVHTSGTTTLELWQGMAHPVAAGHAFTAAVGCDKTFATCAATFANTLNFRGFPHIPGGDFITLYPNSDDPNLSGESLWKYALPLHLK